MRLMLALVVAFTATSARAADEKADPPDKGKLVCIKEAVTGSRFARKVCKTRSEWDEERREAREMLERSTRVQTNPVG